MAKKKDNAPGKLREQARIMRAYLIHEDLLGWAFDVFLRGKYASNEGLATYLTPSQVVECMSHMVFHDITDADLWVRRGDKDQTDTHVDKLVGKFDLILINSPFGSGKYDDPTGMAKMRKEALGLELGWKWKAGNRSKKRELPKADSAALFVDRNLQLLKPGGKLLKETCIGKAMTRVHGRG